MQVHLMERSLPQPPPWKMGLSFCSSLPFKKVQGENVSPVLPSWHNLLCGFRIHPVGVRSWEAANWSSSVIKWYFVLVTEPFIWKLDIPLFVVFFFTKSESAFIMEEPTQRSRELKLRARGQQRTGNRIRTSGSRLISMAKPLWKCAVVKF